IGEGKLIGGHIDTFNFLLSTDYMPKLKNSIFFFEDSLDNQQSGIRRLFRALIQLKQAGAFEDINGLIVGKIGGCNINTYNLLLKGIMSLLESFNFPILTNVDIGHTEPKLTLPIGNCVKLNSEYNNYFEITESSVDL
ncbi:MAG: hypothetical protein M1500_01510, partial [Candidatus Marsarchaeota archaeon]|nr:hypothetical protein [Candidatus Marsarchaeota archaeon]